MELISMNFTYFIQKLMKFNKSKDNPIFGQRVCPGVGGV